MKKVALLLAVVMLMSIVSVPGMGETAQVTVKATVKPIIEVDGLQFKDLNNNGSLDVYEDWRADIEDRVTNLMEQMTLDEKVALLFHTNTGGQYSPPYPRTDDFINGQSETVDINGTSYMPMWYSINVLGCTTYLDNNTGVPQEQAAFHNTVQEIAEGARLGVPVTFTCDREYNTWGSMVDMAHSAFGVAHDKELLSKLVSIYAKEMRAIGFHVVLHSYGVEIGSWYGEEPEYLADMTAAETIAIENQNLAACTKHFIARGGRSSYDFARSLGDMWESYMVPWKAVVDAGTSWVMTNNGAGLSHTVNTDYDAPTIAYLRNELGFDGVVCTDWGSIGGYFPASGVTVDGVDLSMQNLGELYTLLLSNGVDLFGNEAAVKGTEIIENPWNGGKLVNFPDILTAAVEDGICSIELVDRAAKRILRSKFDLGLFENPYSDIQQVLELACSAE